MCHTCYIADVALINERTMPGAQAVTLSLRISAALRDRLEKIRELRSRRKGESISTSEVAKELLESTREDELEEVRLFARPTETLLEIRRKSESGYQVSRAEWVVVAHFVQQGLEALGKNPVSRESVTTVLKAFQAVYELRSKNSSNSESHYYFYNLPSGARGGGSEIVTPEMVRQAVSQTLEMSNAGGEWEPVFIGRNLYVLLDREELSGIDKLNQALKPYWPVLWRVAARGHYHVKGQPIRDKSKQREYIYQPAILPIQESPQKPRDEDDKYTLSFVFGEGNELSLLLSLPGPERPMYPLGPYPKIAEFRAMLAKLEARDFKLPDGLLRGRLWEGEYFFGYVTERKKQNEYWFRARDNGITFGFTEERWELVRRLFRRAWEIPEINRQWDILSLEYGEL